MEMMTLNEWLTHNNLSETVDNINKYEHYIFSTISTYKQSMKPSIIKIELEIYHISNDVNVKQTLYYEKLSDKEIEDKLFNDLIKLIENTMILYCGSIHNLEYQFYNIKEPVLYINDMQIIYSTTKLLYIKNANIRKKQYILNKQYNYNFPTDRAIINKNEWNKYINI